MKKRLALKCWKCTATFELTLDITGKPEFLKECPYCLAPCCFDLDRYRQSTTEVLKGTPLDVQKQRLNLPKEIPTTEPSKED